MGQRDRPGSSINVMTSALPRKSYEAGARGPLAGVRALDLSRLVAGNTLTQVLGDFGAEVVKVEPPAGDTLRAWRVSGVPTNGDRQRMRGASGARGSCAAPPSFRQIHAPRPTPPR